MHSIQIREIIKEVQAMLKQIKEKMRILIGDHVGNHKSIKTKIMPSIEVKVHYKGIQD